MTTMEYSCTLIIRLTVLMYFLFPYRLSYNKHASEPFPSAVQVSLSNRITETIRDQGEVHCHGMTSLDGFPQFTQFTLLSS